MNMADEAVCITYKTYETGVLKVLKVLKARAPACHDANRVSMINNVKYSRTNKITQ